MKRRIFAFLMAFVMLVSAVPAEVLATTVEEDAGTGMYFIGDTLWLPEGEEPAAEVVETGAWVKTEETKTESQLVCPEAEHAHIFNCPVDEEGNYTCGGGEDHVHVTDGCASDCAVAEHAHGETCYQTATLVKWEVVLKEDSYTTYANGTDLGWEYAIIEASYRNGQFRGYDLTNPTGSNHLGSHLTVTINGTNVSEYNNTVDNIVSNALSKSTTGKVVISVNPGSPYYISEMILACGDRSSTPNPFGCDTKSTSDAYTFPISGTPTSVTANLSAIYNVANHGSNDDDYFIMIELAPLPAPVYVGYDSGVAGTHDIAARPVSETGNIEYTASGTAYTATPVGSYPTWSYPTAASTHNALGISPEAEAEANAHGYSFAGWHLEYYTQYAESSNSFSGEMSVGGTNLFKGTPVTLTVHAKLTAIWQPMTTVSVSKVWNDSDNRDGVRPDSVVVHLLRNGVHNGSSVTLNADNNWSAIWNVPTKDENGNAITWSVQEEVPQGYTAVVTGDASKGFVITNSRALDRTSVDVQKAWSDDNNRDGIRPYGVKVQLYKNGEAVTSYIDASGNEIPGIATLIEANSWSYEWLGLEKNKPGAVGQANEYTVQEIGYVDKDGNSIANPGYTASQVKDADTGVLLITNTHQSTVINIPVEKVWDDDDNRDGKRPDSVTVTLTAGGEATDKTLVLNADNNWKGVFEGVYQNANGQPIHYSVVENGVAGYTVAVTGSAANGFVVTNTHTPETISVPVTKVWADGENQDGIRPGSITVQLYADGAAVDGKTLTLSAADKWQGSFDGLDKYQDGEVGKEIVYTVVEVGTVDGYTATVDGNTITNTHTPATVNLNVQKVWNDKGNQDGKRSYAVVITLYANGHPLLKDSKGNLVFEAVTDETGYERFALTLNEANNWTGKWENMPQYHNGQRISYTVVETGYIQKKGDAVTEGVPVGYTVSHEYATVNEQGEAYATVTNSYTPELTDLNVQKDWDDEDNRAGKRPGSVTITLRQKIGDGEWETTTQTVVLSPANEWEHTFEDLPKYSGGQPITYDVVETALDPDLGYDAPAYEYDAKTRVITITNTRHDEKVSVQVNKTWVDANNQDGKRLGSVTVTLYANGIKTSETRTLNADNNWTATFEDLYKHYMGKEVVYSVEETAVDGYTATYSSETATVDGKEIVKIKVTNTHIPEVISIPVTKEWVDADDQDGIRPDSITVQLYAGGEEVTGKILTLNAQNNWQGSFDGLDKNQGGTAIIYTVQEVGHTDKSADGTEVYTDSVPEKYTPTVSGDMTNGFKVTNVHEAEKTYVKATKVWNEKDGYTAERPQEITLHLMKNGAHMGESYKIVLDGTADKDGESEAWVATWTGLDMYAEGKVINYTVYEEITTELATKGYSASYSSDNDGNAVITNTREADKTSFTVQKVWEDADNQDNVRYDGVVVQLFLNGEPVESYSGSDGNPISGIVTLTTTNHWRHTWTDLNVNNANGNIEYTVKELYYVTLDAENAEKQVKLDEDKYREPENNLGVLDTYTGVAVIRNIHEVDTMDVSVEKSWDDRDNQDGKRPFSVVVELNRNGQSTGITAELNSENGWTHTFEKLPVHHGIGIPNVYTVVEVGYTDKDGNWQTGVAPGYTAAVTGTAAGGYTVTNTHSPELISIPVTKEWVDADDQDGIRPDSITVQLYADGAAVDGKTLTLSAADKWQGSFDGLDKFKAGKEIKYTVKEVGTVAGYTATVDGNTITNTHTPATVNLNVEKKWVDADNQDGKRSFAVVITLYANGKPTTNTLTLNEANQWSGKWGNMPQYHNGQRISYTVVETGYIQKEGDAVSAGVPEGYTVTHKYIAVNEQGDAYATVTNSYTPELTDLNVQKVWDDDDNRAGKRPESVTVTLRQKIGNGEWETTTKTAVLSPANEWEHTFDTLPKYSGGQPITYDVVEAALDSDLGYAAPAYKYDAKTRVITITNIRHDEKVNVTVKKDWDDTDNQDGKRPGSVTVTLYANGIDAGVSKTLNADNNWTATFEDLYKHYMGKEVVYSVEETAVDGYTAAYSSETVTVDGQETVKIKVTNTHIPEVISIPVTKIWDDAHNQDGIRPASIELTLYANGTSTGKTVTLTADNNWTAAFDALKKYANGKEIAYTVEEKAVDGYNVVGGVAQDVTADMVGGAITVTNTHEPEKTKVTATKVWDDGNDQDGIRPDSITVHLLKNGAHMGESYKIVLDGEIDENGETAAWVATWDNLDKYAAGQEIVYTVYEEIQDVTTTSDTAGRGISDYIPSYTYDPENWNNITITNRYVPETTTVTVLKVWNDGGDRDGLRPESIQVELFADDVSTGKILVLNEANGWSDAWTGLAKYRDHGVEIKYSVKEVSVPIGYTVNVVQDTQFTAGMFVITNSYTPKTTGVSVQKIWNDENNNDGKRPDGIIVQLYANGSAVEGARIELNEMNNWSYIWHDGGGHPLYVFDKGEEISYYVDEVGYVIDGKEYKDLPEGYTKSIVSESYSTSITNTRETEKFNISVEKLWMDSDNNDGIRPNAVTMTLYCNGEAVNTVELSEANNWTHTWEKLYKYVAGEEAEYHVKETEIAGYTATYETKERADGGVHWTVTNTHEIETKEVTVSKVWKDNKDKEGYRPDSVKVRLYLNGKVYGDTITLSADNGWKQKVTLPVYDNGTEIKWTIAETKIPKYYSATYDQENLTVTNTIQSKEIPKTGDDSNLMLWVGMLILSSAGAVAVLIDDRRRRAKRS